MKLWLILCCVFLFLQIESLYGQGGGPTEELPFENIIPASPEATSLGKYGEFPVTMSSGTPNISIPLTQITGNKLSVPLSLSYHASGNKVQSLASWVGLGWSLNAGGAITRSCRGLPDEDPNGWLEIKDSIPDYGHMSNEAFTILNDLANGIIDGEPDVFYYNFNGYSGQFVFGDDGEIYTIPYKNLKIEWFYDDNSNGVENNLYKFIITTEDGTKYYFGSSFGDDKDAVETTLTYYSGTVNHHCETSWFLTQIVTKNNSDTISFDYVNNAYDYYFTESERLQCLVSGNSDCGQINSCDYSESNGSTILLNTKKLNQINSKTARISFSTSTRADLNNADKLDAINIYSRIGSSDQFEFEKKIAFYYSYMNEGSQYSYEKRLMLDSICEMGTNNHKKPPYRLEYNPTEIPSRNSLAQDHWGYYNGADNNSSLIPEELWSFGGDREPNGEKMKAGILEAIYFPTGGYSKFEYEPHHYATSKSSTNTLIRHTAVALGSDGTTSLPNQATDINRDTIRFFYPDHFRLQTAELDISLSGQDIVDQYDGTHHCMPHAYIKNITTGEILRFRAADHNYYKTTIYNLFPGSQYEIFVEAYWTEFAHARITISYEKPTLGSLPDSAMTGGLRIKRMKTYGEGTEIIKTFNYVKENDPNISSGMRLSQPNYTHRSSNIILDDGAIPGIKYSCDYEIHQSSSTAPLGSSGGSPVYYKTVIENIGEFGNSGKVIHNFNVVTDIGNISYPFAPRFDMDWARGKLVNKKIYKFDRDQNKHVLQQEIINEYNEFMDNPDNSKVFWGLKVGYTATGVDLGYVNNYDPLQFEKFFVWEYFPIFSKWMYQTKRIEKNYDLNNPANYSTKSTEYIYDNQDHAQITRIRTSESDGSTIIEENRYLEDVIYLKDCDKEKSICLADNFHEWKNCQVLAQDRFYNSAFDQAVLDYHDCMAPCWSDFWDCIDANEKTWLEEFLGTIIIGAGDPCSFELGPCDNCDDEYEVDVDLAISSWLTNCKTDSSNRYNTCITNYNTCLSNQTALTSNSEPYIKLFEKHADNTLIEKLIWKIPPGQQDRQLLSSRLYEYKVINTDQVVLDKISQYDMDQPLPESSYLHFNILQDGSIQKASEYRKLATIHNYDEHDNILSYSKPEDVTKTYIWGYNKSKPIAEIINASVDECLYLSFEPGEAENDVLIPDSPIKNESIAITGEYFSNLSTANLTIQSIPPGDYILSFWSDNLGEINTGSAITINSQNISDANKNGYKLYQYIFECSSTSGNHIDLLSGQSIDELRMHPDDAFMNTISYDLNAGQSDMNDPNNIISSFQYDDFNRLSIQRNFKEEIRSKISYAYKENEIISIDQQPAYPQAGKSVSFSVLNTFRMGSIQSYEWDFGDGSELVYLSSPSHTYEDAGEYILKLKVTDSYGKTRITEKTITVGKFRLTGNISPTPDNPQSLITNIEFPYSITNYYYGAPIVSWLWNFGDGTTSTVSNPSHTYSSPGRYKITLYIEDTDGNYGTLHEYLYVRPFNVIINHYPTNRIYHDSPRSGEEVTFEVDELNISDIDFLVWDYGDSSPPDTVYNTGDPKFTSTHTYDIPALGYNVLASAYLNNDSSYNANESVRINSHLITDFEYEIEGSTNQDPNMFNASDTVTGEVHSIDGGYKPYSVSWTVRIEDTNYDTILQPVTYNKPYLTFYLSGVNEPLDFAKLFIKIKVTDEYNREYEKTADYIIRE